MLQGALDQTFGDYEIIVSDNTSSDETVKVARQVGYGIVRYLRTDTALSMNESLEFALSKAHGERMSFLFDDAFCPLVVAMPIVGFTRNFLMMFMRDEEYQWHGKVLGNP